MRAGFAAAVFIADVFIDLHQRKLCKRKRRESCDAAKTPVRSQTPCFKGSKRIRWRAPKQKQCRAGVNQSRSALTLRQCNSTHV
jgi:hypothetical protein